jgi:hypothetical protein
MNTHKKPPSSEFRVITFDGVEMPRSLMAASVLGSILPSVSDRAASWLWKLRSSCGLTRQEEKPQCHEYALQLIEEMLCHRTLVVEEIKERLQSHGFDPEQTYREWIESFRRIAELAVNSEGNCTWSAPVADDDAGFDAVNVTRITEALE